MVARPRPGVPLAASIALVLAIALGAMFSSVARASAIERFTTGQNWDWQLTEPLDLKRDVQVLDLHPDLVTAETMAGLKARGVKTICYVSVGTVEKTSHDRSAFPADVIGKVYGDWPDEQFLDIRRIDVLLPIMTARFERCKALGFDAVEPDNMDVYDNESGFDISADDAVAYVEALAKAAHGLDLAIAQKNVPALTSRLVGQLDFIVTESCFQDKWCDQASAYQKAGKAIFQAEYLDRPLDLAAACKQAGELGMSLIAKDRDLTSQLMVCPM